MIVILWNIGLAIFWAAISGEFNVTSLLLGLLIGNLVLYLANGALGILWYFLKIKAFLFLTGILFIELIHSSLRIASDILSLKTTMRPGIIKVPLEVSTPLEITLLSNMISLTPGTLSVAINEESSSLYIHVMYLPPSFKDVAPGLKKKYESLVLELLR